MSKVLTISVPAESASDLASRLGVPKTHSRRIFEIVAKASRKAASAHMKFNKGTSKSRSMKAAASRISHSRQRTNGKSAKTSR
jgi:hypothetical protein